MSGSNEYIEKLNETYEDRAAAYEAEVEKREDDRAAGRIPSMKDTEFNGVIIVAGTDRNYRAENLYLIISHDGKMTLEKFDHTEFYCCVGMSCYIRVLSAEEETFEFEGDDFLKKMKTDEYYNEIFNEITNEFVIEEDYDGTSLSLTSLGESLVKDFESHMKECYEDFRASGTYYSAWYFLYGCEEDCIEQLREVICKDQLKDLRLNLIGDRDLTDLTEEELDIIERELLITYFDDESDKGLVVYGSVHEYITEMIDNVRNRLFN